MAKFISNHNPVSARSIKRRPNGAVVVRHFGRVDVKFTRVHGGWKCEDFVGLRSSADVARECNSAAGCKESWARVY